MDEIDGSKAVFNEEGRWHQYGTVLPQHTFTAEQAIAVLNPTGEPTRKGRVIIEIDVENDKGEMETISVPFPDKSGMVDFDHDQNAYRALSVMDKDFGLVQLEEKFAISDMVIGRVDGAQYSAAVKLRKGRQTAFTIDMGDFTLDPNGVADRNKRYLWVFDSVDGSWRLRFKFGAFRVVCANTAAMALHGSTDKDVIGSEWSTKHTTNIMERVQEAAQVLGLWKTHEKLFEAQAEHMIQTQMHPDKFGRIIEGLFTADNPDTGVKETDKEAVETVRMIRELSPSSRDVQDVIWGGFNAVTEYHDRVLANKARGGRTSTADELRFVKRVEDPTNLKQRAWDAFWDYAQDVKPFTMPDLASA